MKTRLLRRLRNKASKEICLRRLTNHKYEIVSHYREIWVPVNKNASINFSYLYLKSYNKEYETNCFINRFSESEVWRELYAIRRGYILSYLIPEYLNKTIIKPDHY